MSYVLDDEVTRRDNHGLVSFDRLRQLWNDPKREPESRYAPELHPLFLRLMERFDLSYKVALPDEATDAIAFWQQFKGTLNQVSSGERKLEGLRYTSLIGQLVPDVRPVHDLAKVWSENLASGDLQQTQICRIVDKQTGQTATAEGLFYQMIVRLHKYSLGRVNYHDSVHWQRGLVLDNAYNGRAFLEHKGNDVHITVRAPYPQGFLTMLTEEVRFLVESFWEGLRCNVMVPCIDPCGVNKPGSGLYDVKSLIESKRENFPKFPCPTCNKWQDINMLLTNAPAAQPLSVEAVYAEFMKLKDEIYEIRPVLARQHEETLGRFSNVDTGIQRLFSQAENNLAALLRAFSDEAKDGPRLFNFVPVDRSKFNPEEWTSSRFRLTLWCEHSHLPLPVLNSGNKVGVYEFDVTRAWVKDAAPFLKAFTITLRTLLPVVFSAAKLLANETIYKAIENELDFGKECIDALITESEEISKLLVDDSLEGSATLVQEKSIQAHGATLREFHSLLKKLDPNEKYGGLVKVMNKRQEFLWVHPQFEKEY